MLFCKVQKDRYTNSNAISQFNRMFDTKSEYCLTSSAASGFFKREIKQIRRNKKNPKNLYVMSNYQNTEVIKQWMVKLDRQK